MPDQPAPGSTSSPQARKNPIRCPECGAQLREDFDPDQGYFVQCRCGFSAGTNCWHETDPQPDERHRKAAEEICHYDDAYGETHRRAEHMRVLGIIARHFPAPPPPSDPRWRELREWLPQEFQRNVHTSIKAETVLDLLDALAAAEAKVEGMERAWFRAREAVEKLRQEAMYAMAQAQGLFADVAINGSVCGVAQQWAKEQRQAFAALAAEHAGDAKGATHSAPHPPASSDPASPRS